MSQKTSFPFGILILVLIIIYVVVAILLPAPKLAGTINEIQAPKSTAAAVSWPSYGQAAIGAVNYGVLATNGEQKAAPIASIAKTILALAVLEQKPLNAGEQGPKITITQADIDLYKSNLAQNGSVMPVQLNDQLTEYQLLQGLLIPSGDNIADTLAIWAFGSLQNYLDYANQMAAKMGLEQTHLADAGGLSPQTVSSAQNLIIIGEKVLENPVLAEIVGQSQAELPVIGIAKNYNTLLGQDNVIGIKTGNTDEAGGCLLFATKNTIGGKEIKMVGAILGATSRAKVLNDTQNFIRNNTNILQFSTIVKAGQVVGNYQTKWGKTINVITKNDINILTANKETLSVKTDLNEINKSLNKGAEVGTVTVTAGTNIFTSPAVLDSKIPTPPIYWKLLHP